MALEMAREPRSWKDARDRVWFLCDRCDAPCSGETAFGVPVDESRADEAGAFLCEECAGDLVRMWLPRVSAIRAARGSIGEDAQVGS